MLTTPTCEDSILLGFFGSQPEGYVVDVGADDPVIGSTTHVLLSRPKWGGLLIEPNPRTFRKLVNYWEDKIERGLVRVQREVIDTDLSECDFFLGEGVSTLLPAWRDRCLELWSHVQYRTVRMKPKRLGDALCWVGAPKTIDYLSIDCEGADFRVLQTMDWDNYRVRLLSYEEAEQQVVPGTNQGAEQFLADRGFVFHSRTKGNVFYRSN